MSSAKDKHSAESLPATGKIRQTLRALFGRETPATPLIRAAQRGDITEIKNLLNAGANPNIKSSQGRTALHEAAVGGQAEAAAVLLAHGADPKLTDNKGRKAFDPENAPLKTLHLIRQHYHRRRTQDDAIRTGISGQAKRLADELERNGIVKVSGLISSDLLTQLRRDFQNFIDHLEAKRAKGGGIYKHYDEEEHFWEKDRAFVTNNAFKYSDALVKFCCNPVLLGAANIYLGRPVHVQRGVAMRYLPSPAKNNDMFGWHHDLDEKRFKVQLLLTGVGGGGSGQNMSFVIGSHKIFHPYEMFFKNKCTLDYCREQLGKCEIFDAIGEAGDIFIFDSNGAHRGNRSESADVRDVFMIEYTADTSYIWGGDVNHHGFDGMQMPTPNPFERLMSAKKLWDQPITRKLPMWLENLPHIDRWL